MCSEKVPLDHSDPGQPADVDRIMEKVARIGRVLTRLRDDAAQAILVHKEAAAEVGLAYAKAWSTFGGIVQQTSRFEGLRGLTAAVINAAAPGVVGWFIGVLFGARAGGEVSAGLSWIQSTMKATIGRKAWKKGKRKHFYAPSGAVDPTLFIAQINARTATMARAQAEMILDWLTALRPIEDEPAAFPWLAEADIAAFEADIASFRAQSPLFQAPEAVNIDGLAAEYERYLWSRWTIVNFEKIKYRSTSTGRGAMARSGSHVPYMAGEPPKKALLRMSQLGLGPGFERVTERFNGEELELLRQDCKVYHR